jgi:hypothetical protein
MSVHFRTRRVWMDLHEQLPDHFSSQSFTNTGELAPGLRCAALAAQPKLRTELGIIVVGGGNHVVNIMPLTVTLTKGFEEGSEGLNCGRAVPPFATIGYGKAVCRTDDIASNNRKTRTPRTASL